MRSRTLVAACLLFLMGSGLAAQPSETPRLLLSESLGKAPPPVTVEPPLAYALSIDADFSLGGYVFKDGSAFLHNDGGSDYGNTALGLDALVSLTPGSPGAFDGAYNTAVGQSALKSTTSGSSNSAFGVNALGLNETGFGNLAVGRDTLASNTAGYQNVAIGSFALAFTDASRNTAVGFGALGYPAPTLGSNNIAIGFRAGYDISSGSNNIFIGAKNVGGGYGGYEADTIRIGRLQTATYIAGIYGQTVEGSLVYANSAGKLGTGGRSARHFKKDIRDLGRISDRLFDLRPVSFRFLNEAEDGGEGPIQYGLVAEEVAGVFPELVAYDEEGQPFSVRYHLLSSLLLNELQKQHRRDQAQWLLIGLLFAGTAIGVWRRGVA